MPMRRKTRAEKEAAGTWKPSRDFGEPDIQACPMPEPPEHLDDTERLFWGRLKLVVDALRSAGAPDFEGFEMMVLERASYERLRLSGEAQPKELRASAASVKGWFAEFGIMPSARTRLRQPAGAEAESAFKSLFRGLKN